MEENKTVAAPAEEGKPKRKTGLWVCLILVGLLVCAYLGLCAYVFFSGRILPNVSVGHVDVSQMTWNEARAALETNTADIRNKVIPFTYGSRGKAEVSGEWVQPDIEQAGADALAVGREGFPLTYGANFLMALSQPTQLDLPVSFSAEGSTKLSGLFQGMGQSVTQTSLTVEADRIELIKGTPGYAYDLNDVSSRILEAYSAAAMQNPLPNLHFDPVRTEPDHTPIPITTANINAIIPNKIF